MLQKLQIVQINDKDLKDALLLLLAASISETDNDAINAKYISKLFSDDWGFYYTATTNLKKIKEAMAGVNALTDDQRAVINEKTDYFLKFIEDTPKTGKWKSRAKVGTSRPWYQQISDWD
jgi:hypothetical protein